MTAEEPQWDQLINGLKEGDPQIVEDFFFKYDPVLRRIANRYLTSGLRRRLDAEDVVQSAFRTFFRRANEGEFEFSDGQKLWNLMCAITLTKVREKDRFHKRRKRSYHRESAPNDDSNDSGVVRFEAADPRLSPSAAAEFSDQFSHLLESLGEEERQVVELKLQECTNEEVAASLGVSERTVRRIVKRLRARLQHDLESD